MLLAVACQEHPLLSLLSLPTGIAAGTASLQTPKVWYNSICNGYNHSAKQRAGSVREYEQYGSSGWCRLQMTNVKNDESK